MLPTIHCPIGPRYDPNEEIQRLGIQVAKLEDENSLQRHSCGLSAPSADLVAKDGVLEPASSEVQRVRAELAAVRHERDLLRVGQNVTHPMDVQTASSSMAALIDAGVAKRRCVDNTLL